MMAIVKWAVAVWQFSLSEQWQMRHKAVSGVFTPTFGWFQTVGLYQPAGQFTGIWLVLQMFSLGRTSYFQRNHCFYKGVSMREHLFPACILLRVDVPLLKKCSIHPRPSSPLRCYDLS